MWRLNNLIIDNQRITEEIKEEIKKYLEANDTPKSMRCSKSSSKSNTSLPQEIRKSSNKQHNFTPKATRERTDKTQSYQKERNHKDQSRNK